MRLTDDAVEDLRRLFRKDPQIVRWCFKKSIQLETDPLAGQPLLGGLIGYRKIVVSDRDWRIVWRVEQDSTGGFVVDVAEVWAVGYRKDSQVYVEIRSRLAASGDSPQARALVDVLAIFDRQASGLSATAEPRESEPVPKWLATSLIRVAGMSPENVAAMTLPDAYDAWNDYITSPDAGI